LKSTSYAIGAVYTGRRRGYPLLGQELLEDLVSLLVASFQVRWRATLTLSLATTCHRFVIPPEKQNPEKLAPLGVPFNVGSAVLRRLENAPEEGFEPPTRRLTAACSAPELLRNGGSIMEVDGGQSRPRDD
jgi:hypothetical protein